MLRFVLSVLLGATLLLTGCEKAPPPKAQVHGKVLVDNEPLKDGLIVFITVGKDGERLPIKDGAYEGMVECGDRRVEFVAYKETTTVKMEGLPERATKENYLPPKYHSRSDLKREVKPGVQNELNFELDTK